MPEAGPIDSEVTLDPVDAFDARRAAASKKLISFIDRFQHVIIPIGSKKLSKKLLSFLLKTSTSLVDPTLSSEGLDTIEQLLEIISREDEFAKMEAGLACLINSFEKTEAARDEAHRAELDHLKSFADAAAGKIVDANREALDQVIDFGVKAGADMIEAHLTALARVYFELSQRRREIDDLNQQVGNAGEALAEKSGLLVVALRTIDENDKALKPSTYEAKWHYLLAQTLELRKSVHIQSCELDHSDKAITALQKLDDSLKVALKWLANNKKAPKRVNLEHDLTKVDQLIQGIQKVLQHDTKKSLSEQRLQQSAIDELTQQLSKAVGKHTALVRLRLVAALGLLCPLAALAINNYVIQPHKTSAAPAESASTSSASAGDGDGKKPDPAPSATASSANVDAAGVTSASAKPRVAKKTQKLPIGGSFLSTFDTQVAEMYEEAAAAAEQREIALCRESLLAHGIKPDPVLCQNVTTRDCVTEALKDGNPYLNLSELCTPTDKPDVESPALGY